MDHKGAYAMISIIAGISGDDPIRKENFVAFIRCVSRAMRDVDCEFIVVEQLKPEDRPIYGALLKENCPNRFYHKQVWHPVFNRSWLFNVAAKESDGDLLVFMDADVVFGDDYFEELVKQCHGNPYYSMGWSRSIWLNERGRQVFLEFPRYTRHWSKSLVKRKLKVSFDPESCKGLSNVFRRGFFFDELGGFNETYSQWGGEDCDIIFRASAAAHELYRMEYTLLHLYHEGRVRGQQNDRMWSLTYALPEFVSYQIITTGIGFSGGPRPLDLEEAWACETKAT